jgi:catalase
MTMASGCPISHMKNSMTAGPTGPVLLQDTVLLEKMEYFSREKIPARNVHALGFGGHGTFTVTNPHLSQYSRANVFSSNGKKTDVTVRFSGVFTEQGDPDTFRDLRGMAIKFYSEEGNWDLLCVNTPVFPVRDMKVRKLLLKQNILIHLRLVLMLFMLLKEIQEPLNGIRPKRGISWLHTRKDYTAC